MRLLALVTALAFSASALTAAQACEYGKTAKSEQKPLVTADKAPKAPSTPIIIPKKAEKSEG